MSATIKAATPQRIIRRKMVYTRESELHGAGNTRPDAKIGHVGFADPKNLYITTHKQALSAACYTGRGYTILLEREKIKRQTMKLRRLQHAKSAA
jgi:hypothetical protein